MRQMQDEKLASENETIVLKLLSTVVGNFDYCLNSKTAGTCNPGETDLHKILNEVVLYLYTERRFREYEKTVRENVLGESQDEYEKRKKAWFQLLILSKPDIFKWREASENHAHVYAECQAQLDTYKKLLRKRVDLGKLNEFVTLRRKVYADLTSSMSTNEKRQDLKRPRSAAFEVQVDDGHDPLATLIAVSNQADPAVVPTDRIETDGQDKTKKKKSKSITPQPWSSFWQKSSALLRSTTDLGKVVCSTCTFLVSTELLVLFKPIY